MPAPRAIGPRRGFELPRVRYLDELAARGCPHVVHDKFPGSVDAAAVAGLGEVVLARVSAGGRQFEAFLRLDGMLVLLDLGWGELYVEVAGTRDRRVAKAVADLRRQLARPAPPPATVSFAF